MGLQKYCKKKRCFRKAKVKSKSIFYAVLRTKNTKKSAEKFNLT